MKKTERCILKKLKIIPLNKGGIEIKTQVKKSKYIRHHYFLAKTLKQITFLPRKEETIHIVTQSQFNALTFIPYFLERERIKQIFISTYSISKKNIDTILGMIDKKLIGECLLLISDFIVNQKKDIVKKLELEASRCNNFKWQHAQNHSKIILIETDSDYYIIEGSGNMTMNARIEQYVFTCSKELYEFHRNWMMGINNERTKRSCI